MNFFKGKSLQFRFSIQVALLAILPTFIVSWVASNFLIENTRLENMKTVGQVADAKHGRLAMLLSNANMRASSFLSSLGTECVSHSGKLDKTCATKLINSYIASEGAKGAELYMVVSSEKLSVGISIDQDKEAFTIQAGQLAKFSGAGPENNRTFFISVIDQSNELQLEVLYPSTILDPIFMEHPPVLGDSGEAFLTDGEGYFVTPARYPSTQGQNHPISAHPMQLCLNGKNSEVLDLDYRGHPIIHGFRFIPELGSACIMAHIDQAEAFAPTTTLAKRLTIAMGGFILLVVLFVMYMARSIAKPIVSLTDELRNSKNQLRLLLDSAAEAIYGIDTQGNCTFCNPTCLKLLGYKHADELIGKNMHELVHHKHTDGTPFPVEECRIYQAFQRGEEMHVDDEVFWRADGTSFPVEYSSHPQFSEGVVIGAVVTFMDISERMLAHKKLLKLSSAVENSPASVVITDVDGTIEYVNQRFTAVTGYSSKEAIGQNPRILSAGVQSKEFYKQMWATLLDGKEWQGEIFNKKNNGEIYLEQASISPIRDNQGSIVYFVAVKEDITERKRITEELQKADRDKALRAVHEEDEARLRSIIDTALDAVVQMDNAGIITGWNSQAEKAFGWTGAEAIGRALHETIIPPQYREAHVQGLKRFLASGEGPILNSRIEITGLHRDGHEFPIELSITPIKTEGKVDFNGFVRDITERRQAEEFLRESEQSFRAIFENAATGIARISTAGQFLQINEEFCRIIGYTREEVLSQKFAFQQITFPDDLEPDLAMVNKLLNGDGDNYTMEKRYIHKNGNIFWVSLSVYLLRNDEKKPLYFISAVQDITKRKQTEAALLEKESQYRMAIETSVDGFWMTDTRGRLLRVNDAYIHLSGYSRDELLNMSVPDLEAEERQEEAAAHLEKLMRGGADKFESRHRRKDGSIWPVQISSAYTPAAGGRFFVFITDLTERKRVEEKMLYLAHYDGLTGLPNRTLFHDRLEQEIKKAHRAGLKMALLFIDLDRFKEVNDTLGHGMGDLLLVEAARRIGSCVRETDTVARLGGDEFIIILSELDDASSVERVAENILQKLAGPFQLRGETAHVSASMGITLYPDDATDMEDLVKDADQAMYVAKHAGRNRLSYFTPALQQAAQTRLRLLNDLRGALAGDQFRVYFQPIVELATGRIHKAEALIRWQHPLRGMVSPAEFIPLAEDSGLIVEIGDWVFKEAARQVKRWRTLHDTGFQISMNMPSHADFQVSVNVSPVQFHHVGSLYQTWRAHLQELELPGESMIIEITEGLLLDADSGVTDKLLEFHDVGIQVSIDDFGTGYSSLSYLKKLDLDYLKIDQSFVRDLATDSNDMALSEAIIVMAHKLGLKVIAEGVETEQQRDLLVAAGCDYAQGYLFSRPVPAKEFEVLLEHKDTK